MCFHFYLISLDNNDEEIVENERENRENREKEKRRGKEKRQEDENTLSDGKILFCNQ